jgi:hypothetical protein
VPFYREKTGAPFSKDVRDIYLGWILLFPHFPTVSDLFFTKDSVQNRNASSLRRHLVCLYIDASLLNLPLLDVFTSVVPFRKALQKEQRLVKNTEILLRGTIFSSCILDMMNASNIFSQAVPERIGLRLGSRPASDARIEGCMADQSHLGPAKPLLNSKSNGPVKVELTAASALTSLVNKPPMAAAAAAAAASSVPVEGDVDFDIPQRFTKSGRKKATPFPVKVCSFSLISSLMCRRNRIVERPVMTEWFQSVIS